MNVSFQGYYKWLERKASSRDCDNKDIVIRIKDIFKKHDGNYGSPRIHAELRAQGEQINHKRVERLIRQLGLVGKAGRIYRRKPLPENACIKVPNIQRKKGMLSKPNQQWAGKPSPFK